ncbi:dTDP-4-dehydrorhamnose 3,5-epimerase [Thiospirochaeta perfilievii]|uniref:dTDP-4-dehydrorhamnose 3,5-epimerase n=1 Tax=Thiospirochaeta perfilievii TaxID=252967 RepID=A0A5C1QG90_9SPIO|nr:dTDP-4-dehydrorhamnose 3,5-epimerase [Thiospirochaeta perfilievii]QEN05624.1 dTDP-4-dehydrorhamnose 3,5-epimerase [Thiospirochaeta perfilievii]
MPFNFKRTEIEGLVIIEPRVFADGRGFFLETYKKSDFVKEGITEEFVQDNHSFSCKGVLRGVHLQKGASAQGKLVRCLAGAVWDVAVDLRPGSATFGKWFGIELSSENNIMFYIPPGFGHGFVTLEDNTHFLYKCTHEYDPKNDSGIIWNDADLAIEWPLTDGLSFSDKDLVLQSFSKFKEGL